LVKAGGKSEKGYASQGRAVFGPYILKFEFEFEIFFSPRLVFGRKHWRVRSEPLG
jgi:hypothetical protein